jgi:hypothetical protein
VHRCADGKHATGGYNKDGISEMFERKQINEIDYEVPEEKCESKYIKNSRNQFGE